MATRVYVLDGGYPKDSENSLNSFLTKRDRNAFWQIGADMMLDWVYEKGHKTQIRAKIYSFL